MGCLLRFAHPDPIAALPRMSPLTWFGVVAVSAMLVTYAFEKRSSWFVLAFAGGCVLASLYGFLAGAWPFGAIEAVWAIVAARRWYVAQAHVPTDGDGLLF